MYKINKISYNNRSISLIQKSKSKPLNVENLIKANSESGLLVDNEKLQQIIDIIKNDK